MAEKKIFKTFLVFIFLLLFPLKTKLLFSQNHIIILENKKNISTKNKVYIMEDKSLDISINDILRGRNKKKFSMIKYSEYHPKITKSAFWITFSIKKGHNTLSRSPWILEINHPNIHYIDFYQTDLSGSIIREKHTGTMRPVKYRDHIYNKFIFYLNLQEEKEYKIFIRFKSESSIELNFSLKGMTEFMSESYKNTISTGVFFGFLIIIFAYNLFLYFSIREKLYLYFSLTIASLFLLILTESGIAQIYLWPEAIRFNYYMLPLSIVFLHIFLIKFTDFFTSSKNRSSNFHTAFNILAGFSFFLLIMIFVLGYYSSIIMIMLYSLLILTVILISVYSLWKNGDTTSGYFLLSYIPIFLIGVFSILEKFKVFSLCLNPDLSRKLGSTFFILLLSIYLARRIKKLKIEKLKTDHDLKDSEKRFKTIVENSHAGIINVDNSFHFTYVNPKFEQIMGYSSSELIGKDFRTFLDGESLALVAERYEKRQRGETVPPIYKFNIKRKDGSIRRIEISSAIVRIDNGKSITVAQLLDITEKERSELMKEIILNISQAVNSKENIDDFYKAIHSELSKLIDTKNFFIGIYDEITNSISLPYIKDEKDSLNRVPANGTISSLVIKENRSMILKPREIKKLESEGKIDIVGSPCKIWLGVPLRTGNKVIGVIVVQSYSDEAAYNQSDLELMEFISDQIAISISKKQNEERIKILSKAIEQGPAIIMITDLNGNIEYVNKKFEEITGYKSDKAIGRNPKFLKSGYTPSSTYSDLWTKISSGGEWRGEFHNKKSDGTLYWENAFITCIRNSEGTPTNYLAVKNDITEKKKMEEQLIQSQKMESIGTLAGGIAHDFNNLLTVINGYSDMLLMKFDNNDPKYREISAIRAAGDRAEKLTRQIMAFSRKQIYKPQIVEINSIITELENMFRSLIGEDINIRTNLTHDLPFIKADPGQIEQILINLLVNARDAVNQKSEKAEEKKITIETNLKTIDVGFIKDHIGSREGTFICLSVSDSGIGMSKEIQNSIFEPFFTTKARDKGTGLGLATVYGIVKQNSGSIYVYSELGVGTTFKIYWPATTEKLIIKDSSVFNKKALSGSETILVVEDDKQVLNFASSTLKNFGYNVFIASNGKKAVKLFKSKKSKFDLLITDLVMPDMNGKELSEEIKIISPHTKILFASGYTDNHLVHKGQLQEDINFLAKPYSTKNLLKAIRDTLDIKEK